jgi:hypothetical protein
MNLNFVSLLVVLFFHLASFAQILKSESGAVVKERTHDSVCKNLKILKIESIKYAYIIDAVDQKNNFHYTIVSLKKINLGGSRIREGKSCKLPINPYFTTDDFVPMLGLTFVIEIEGKVIVVPSRSWTNNLYYSENLTGLRYKTIHKTCN